MVLFHKVALKLKITIKKKTTTTVRQTDRQTDRQQRYRRCENCNNWHLASAVTIRVENKNRLDDIRLVG